MFVKKAVPELSEELSVILSNAERIILFKGTPRAVSLATFTGWHCTVQQTAVCTRYKRIVLLNRVTSGIFSIVSRLYITFKI